MPDPTLRRAYVPELVVCRWLAWRGVMVEPCSSCITEEDDGYGSCAEIDLGRGRWTSATCTVASALREEGFKDA